ncbi:MAG: DnaA N-terminal domain-containing protein [Pseudomonadota bacterium]
MRQVCLKQQIREPGRGGHENSLKGVAKRADNFEEVTQNGAEYQGYPLSRLDLMRAAAIGTGELSDAARSLLIVYLCHLDTRRLGEGLTCVWPGNESVGQAIGKTDSTIRRLKGDLEKAGYIVRQYDCRNRPLEGGAIDLSPFLTAAPAILHEIEAKSAARKQAWADARKPSSPMVVSISSGEPPKSARQNSTRKLSDSCLELLDLEKVQEGKPSTNTRVIVEAKQLILDQQAINQALDLSKRLKNEIDPKGKGVSPAKAAECIWEALPKLFPNDGAHSLSHTFLWCAKRHGAKAFLYLAVALEDPTIKDPRKMFGWFATHTEDIDLSRNLERIKHKPKPVDLQETAPKLPGGAFENEIGQAIADRIGVPAYNSWFNPQSIRFVVKTDKMIIEHANGFARDEINKRFARQLNAAAKELSLNGFEMKDLE